MVAGDGGLDTEVGLELSIQHSVADPVRAAVGVKDQEIRLTHTHRLNAAWLLQTLLWWLMRCLS